MVYKEVSFLEGGLYNFDVLMLAGLVEFLSFMLACIYVYVCENIFERMRYS